MMDNLRSSTQKLWRHLTWPQRLSIFGLSASVVAAIALLVMWASTPTYTVLFSSLSTTDANAIVTSLQGSKTPYQLADGGTAVLVPQSMVDAERLQLAGQGLPQSGVVGYELIDKTSSSPFQADAQTQALDRQRALEGELTRTISQISGVSYASVHLVLPQTQLFSTQQADTTASVLLKFDPGASLTSDQIAGIQHLVSSSVQGLKSDAVTVVDGSGTIISSNTGVSTGGALALTAQQAETRVASNLGAQLTAMLDTVVGPDKAIVRVNDVMDWTQRDSTSNTYQSQSKNSPLGESRVITSSSTGPATTVGGVAGLGSNVPNYGTTKGGSNGGVTQTQANIDNTYLPSSTITHVTQAPGAVKQTSVAVLLNGVTNQNELRQLRAAVIAAAGLNLARGDVLSISSVPFDNSVAIAAATAAKAQQQQTLILSIARWAALVIVPLVLLFLLRRMLVSSRVKRFNELDEPGLEVIEEGQEPDATAMLAGPGNVAAIAAPQDSAERKAMVELAREKPELVAGLIGRWIEEDRG